MCASRNVRFERVPQLVFCEVTQDLVWGRDAGRDKDIRDNTVTDDDRRDPEINRPGCDGFSVCRTS